MEVWLKEIIDQMVLGELPASTSISCGTRFALIAMDNAMEYMLIAYITLVRQVIGGQGPEHITLKEWNEISRAFDRLLGRVVKLCPELADEQAEILRKHSLRNDLYHSGLPITVNPSHVRHYLDTGKTALRKLFAITLTDEEWAARVASLGRALESGKPPAPAALSVIYESIDDGSICFTTPGTPTHHQAIGIVLTGLAKRGNISPDYATVLTSLQRSGLALSYHAFTSRIAEMRRKGWLQKERLALSAQARKDLAKHFQI